MKEKYIIPVFVPHLGCPNDCIFCNQKSISGQKEQMTKEKAKEIIDKFLKEIQNRRKRNRNRLFWWKFHSNRRRKTRTITFYSL